MVQHAPMRSPRSLRSMRLMGFHEPRCRLAIPTRKHLPSAITRAPQLRSTVIEEFDAQHARYYYFNAATRESAWAPPRLLRGAPLRPAAAAAALRIQTAWRAHRARARLATLLDAVYEREYSRDADAWFYFNRATGEASWKKPRVYGAREPPAHEGDVAVLEKEAENRELRRRLEDAEARAAAAAAQLATATTAALVRAGAADADDARGRPRHMDEWAPVQVGMRKYRLRFERKQRGGGGGRGDRGGGGSGGGDSDDSLSDASASDTPSELLQGTSEGGREYLDEESEGEANRAQAALLEGEAALSDAELAELQRDAANIEKEVMFAGDADDRPEDGDVVHYTCTLRDGGAVVESTRKTRRCAFEFVLGAGAVIRGLDRGVARMAFGERARITVSAEYAYGERGFPPIIPPGAALVFDVNLIRFWPRPRWRKPLIQATGPYTETPYDRAPVARSAARDNDDAASSSKAASREGKVDRSETPVGRRRHHQ
ncbi:hypothetical protein JKP88DRAFT_241995 [Tribonema minus]|uniref:peptidylprolyl isomerase n=1 Tax=Tribonema minus TaxID=303371 RepID=A0A836CB63_9STRA|nr:hypothetical protein JKP88DRAFT_241995 [Tribonema minus]